MDEFERTIRTTLSDTSGFDTAKAETLRKETVQMFEDKLKKVYRYAWLYLIICVAAGGVAGACFGVSASLGSTWGMIASAVMFLGAGQCMVTIKLWYWIMNNKLNVLREVKQIQLQLAELAGKDAPAEN
ncbi:unnamed protein product [marine sediment metagenome]|uniref:SMODS and SLOG-associating 2TM effector domain-containing protein n=1 Tax=marine sediment metagenome TaxID=412755 RepID=X1KRK9_9ZZZZ